MRAEASQRYPSYVNCISPFCHSEAGFIGEESAVCRQRNSRFLAR